MSRNCNNNGYDDDSPLLEELKLKFPLVTELVFSRDDSPEEEELPPFISLLASFTDPAIDGDACVVPATASRQGCNIKGNVNGKGQRICHMPGQEYYEQTQISESRGERWFCSESEARAAGWRAAKH